MITGIVYGVVTSEGRGLAGASVSTDIGVSATTLPTGHYLMFVPSGTYDMAAFKGGYAPSRKDNVSIGNGAMVVVDFDLKKS